MTGALARAASATRRRVERRRHHEEAQILAQAAARIECQREPRSASSERSWNSSKITQPMPVECGIVEDQAREHALGHDLDAGFRADARVEPCADADRLSDPLAAHRRHALGGGTGRKPARLEQQDLAAVQPGLPRAAPAAPASSCRRLAARPAPPTGQRPVRRADRPAPRRREVWSGPSCLRGVAEKSRGVKGCLPRLLPRGTAHAHSLFSIGRLVYRALQHCGPHRRPQFNRMSPRCTPTRADRPPAATSRSACNCTTSTGAIPTRRRCCWCMAGATTAATGTGWRSGCARTGTSSRLI